MQKLTAIRFDIIDRHTGKIVTTALTRAGASRAVDRRDNAYGAYRFHAKPIYQTIPLHDALETLHCRKVYADYADGMLFDCRTGENICAIVEGTVCLDMVMTYGA